MGWWRREPVVILGAGEFGRDILDVLDAINRQHPRFHVLGFLDPSGSALPDTNRLGGAVIGIDGDLARFDARYVIGSTVTGIRRDIDRTAAEAGRQAVDALVHPTCSVGGDVELGGGTVVNAGVRVASNVVLGRHTHVDFNSTIGRDVIVGNYVTVRTQVSVGPCVTIGECATLGSGTIVLPGVHIGPFATIGAGAVVDRDVAISATAIGVPERQADRHSSAGNAS